MGLFKRFFKNGIELNVAANAVAKVLELLEEYESNHELGCLCLAAWVTKVGFLDIAERNNWKLHFKIFITFHGTVTRMTIAEATMRTLTRICFKADLLLQDEKEYVHEILEKGDAFYQIERKLPQDFISQYKR